ncbi:MAG: hypothetical protein ACR2I8_11270, partial [Steroidobacteraceae bacterium]
MRTTSTFLVAIAGLALLASARAADPSPQQDEAAALAAFKDAMVAKGKDGPPVDRETLPGADHYRRYCAVCHEGQVDKAPSKTFL